jgi:hypothetical protein
MYILDPQSLAVGMVLGVGIAGNVVAFAAMVVVHHSSDTDKRGLGRHRPGELRGHELPGPRFSALPVVAPQKDLRGPVSSTGAGGWAPAKLSAPRPCAPRRSRPASPPHGHS